MADPEIKDRNIMMASTNIKRLLAGDVAVQVVVAQLAAVFGSAAEYVECAVAEQPHTYVHQEIGARGKLAELPYGGLLQHGGKFVGAVAVNDEDTVVRGKLGVDPDSVAHHVGFRNRPGTALGAYQHIAAGDERAQRVRRILHDFFIKRHLQREQRLANGLPGSPAENRHRRKHLANRGLVTA